MTTTEQTQTQCQAFDHKGTVRCTKVATYRVWDLKTHADMGLRCAGHTRKFRVHETFWKVEKV